MSGLNSKSEKISSTTDGSNQSTPVKKTEEKTSTTECKEQAEIGCVTNEQEKSSSNDHDTNILEELDPFKGMEKSEVSDSSSSNQARRMNSEEFNEEFQNLVWQKHLMGTEQYDGLLNDLFLQVGTEQSESSHQFMNPTAKAMMKLCESDESSSNEDETADGLGSLPETSKPATRVSTEYNKPVTQTASEYWDINQSTITTMNQNTMNTEITIRPTASIAKQKLSVVSAMTNNERSWLCCYPRRKSGTPEREIWRPTSGHDVERGSKNNTHDLPAISEKIEQPDGEKEREKVDSIVKPHEQKVVYKKMSISESGRRQCDL